MSEKVRQMLAENERIEAAMFRATRAALLEHARMGRSVPQSRTPGGPTVWVTPAEIFARYGYDEFGRPLPGTDPADVGPAFR